MVRPIPIRKDPGKSGFKGTFRLGKRACNKRAIKENQPRVGFVNFAETWNGRMAMMGILIGLGTELITGQSILRQIGIG